MKKFLMIAVMAVAALTAKAQQGEYYITPKLDLGYAILSDVDGGDIKGGLVGGLGVDFEYMVADQFGLSAGVTFKYFDSDKVNDQKVTASYLDIPVMANYHLGQFTIKAGVKPSIKTSYKWDYKDGTISHDISEVAKSFLFYVPVGVSYKFGSTSLGLNVDIPCSNMEKAGVKMMPIYLSVGYTF